MKPIPGYEDCYSAEEDGRIYSHLTKKYLKFCKSEKGYFRCQMYKNGVAKCCSVARLIAETFIPNLDNKPQIDHIDRNTINNNVSNLRWVTPSENNLNRGILKNNKLGEKNIRYRPEKKTKYSLSIMIEGVILNKSFKTLEEAVKFRNEYLGTN